MRFRVESVVNRDKQDNRNAVSADFNFNRLVTVIQGNRVRFADQVFLLLYVVCYIFVCVIF